MKASARRPRETTILIETTGSVTAQTEACQLLAPRPELVFVRRGGTLIGHDGDTETRTPHDDAVLILPTRRPRRGLIAVRFGRVRGGLEIGLPILDVSWPADLSAYSSPGLRPLP